MVLEVLFQVVYGSKGVLAEHRTRDLLGSYQAKYSVHLLDSYSLRLVRSAEVVNDGAEALEPSKIEVSGESSKTTESM